jgi:hypothetical protein
MKTHAALIDGKPVMARATPRLDRPAHVATNLAAAWGPGADASAMDARHTFEQPQAASFSAKPGPQNLRNCGPNPSSLSGCRPMH